MLPSDTTAWWERAPEAKLSSLQENGQKMDKMKYYPPSLRPNPLATRCPRDPAAAGIEKRNELMFISVAIATVDGLPPCRVAIGVPWTLGTKVRGQHLQRSEQRASRSGQTTWKSPLKTARRRVDLGAAARCKPSGWEEQGGVQTQR